MESGIGSAQDAVASPAISRRSSCPWSLCYTRCYTQAAISMSPPLGSPTQEVMPGRAWLAAHLWPGGPLG
jgi:hypothetical protein